MPLAHGDGGIAGGWIGRPTGFAGPGLVDWSGQGVGRGYGDLVGPQTRMDLEMATFGGIDGDTFTGVIVDPSQ